MKFQKDIKIILNQKIYEDLIKCVKNASPNEACGFIFGNIKEIGIPNGFQYHYFGKKFECMESNKKSPVSFFIENIEELNKIFQEASQKFNLQLISIFHSHPAGAYPSGADLRNMEYLDNFENRAFRNQIWTIMDATNKKVNGFIFFNKELMQINVEINKK